MGDKIVKSKNLCCQPVVFPSLTLLSAYYLPPFVSAACLAPVPSLLIKLFTLLDEAIATVSGEATSTATEEGKKMTL